MLRLMIKARQGVVVWSSGDDVLLVPFLWLPILHV